MAGADRKKRTAAGSGTGSRGAERKAGVGARSRQPGGNAAAKSGSGRTASGGKKSAAAKSAGRGRRREPEIEENSFIGTEVAIIVSFAISVLLFLSNFYLCGAVGDVCRVAQLGMFGSIGYIAPILLFAGTCFYMSNRGDLRAVMKMAAMAVLILSLCGLAQLLFGGGYIEGQKLLEYYARSGASGDGGGLLGGLLVTALCTTVGKIGAYLIFGAMLVISAVCITEKSFVDFVRRGSGRAYQYAREDMDRRRELHEERREEKRRLREEQRVRGVNLDATSLMDAPLMREFASGIPEGTILSGDEEAYEPDVAEMERPASPADVFRGNVTLPHDRLDEPDAGREPIRTDREPIRSAWEPEEKEPEECHPVEQEPGGGSRRSSRTAPRAEVIPLREYAAAPSSTAAPFSADSVYQDGADDELLKSIYVRRDTRTLEEMALEEKAEVGGKDAPMEQGSARSARECAWRELSAEGAGLEDVGHGEDRVYGSTEIMDDTGELSGADSFGAGSRNTGSFEEESFDTDFYEQKTFEAETYERDYPEAPGGSASRASCQAAPAGREEVSSDTFFIPEEPKTVVTASGKVIDTDTEQVRKTIERKREGRRALPDDELTVHEQIERKTGIAKAAKKEYLFPSLNLLKRGPVNAGGFSEKEYRDTAIKLQQTLQNFGVGVTVTNISCGPSVTRYELHPEQGVKVSKIVSLADDIKLNLAAADIRIEAPIPGKAAVGIEVPNKENNTVYLRDLLESEAFRRHSSRLAFAVGKDIAGQAVVTDIAKMPHLLIAGATGSGKSVCINTLIMSVLYKANPEDVKLIMIDPKVVELSVYNGIPHLLIPVVTDPKKASGALNWAVAEMSDRYQKFAKYNVRDLKGYNDKIAAIEDIEDENKPEKLPQIIIIVDELADLMMVAPGEVEDAICRLAQLARAAGLHLVIATQRPSVNVITGLIKANIPSRIAFSVSSGVDSRTIIDMNGAEKLLGKGDMLFYPSGYQKPQRVQGAFVSDQEVSRVVEFLTEQGMTAEYNPEIETRISMSSLSDGGSGGNDRDAYFVQAGRFIIEKDKASIGMLQRMFKIGFNRAARIMDQLAEAGVVGDEEGTKPRKVLMTMEQFENLMEE